MANPSKKIEENQGASRLVPFTVAGIICFGGALILGVGSWYLFGTKHKLSPEKDPLSVQTSNREAMPENSNAAAVPTPANAAAETPPTEIKKAPAGEVPINGGEVTLGGDESKLPLRRVAVESFSIAATEVTNAQYAEFVKETKRAAPTGWKNDQFPNEGADEPVVGVTWSDANAYCDWLGKKLGVIVRLPNEAEWELAARGATDFKYPWGNDWNDEAAASLETKGKIRAVKSYPKGRSPLGVYEMIGNVWEWTSDLFTDEFGNPVLYEKTRQRVIKGGSAKEERKFLSVKTRAARPEDKAKDVIGFRYVVVRR